MRTDTIKDAYLKYAQAYKSASPSQAIEKLNQLKAIAPDCLEADKELAEVYYATNRFGKAADTYAKFIDTPVATEDDILKYAFALFLNHDFEKSLAVAQKGLQKNARHAAFNRLVMYNNVDLKRYDEAEKAADAFFNASDNADYSCLDYRYHGALLSALKKYDQAIEEYGKALEKDESQVDLWREIADAYDLKNPSNNESAGKKKSVRIAKAGAYLKPMMVQCALAAIKNTGAVSVVYALEQSKFVIPFLTQATTFLPGYGAGLGWIVPAFAGMAAGIIYSSVMGDQEE